MDWSTSADCEGRDGCAREGRVRGPIAPEGAKGFTCGTRVQWHMSNGMCGGCVQLNAVVAVVVVAW